MIHISFIYGGCCELTIFLCGMPKDARYNTAQKLVQGGHIHSLTELFEAVDKTPLARDMKTAPARLTKLIQQPDLFTFRDCHKIATILEVDPDKIIDLIREETRPRKGRKK